jgi:hypothetical protein
VNDKGRDVLLEASLNGLPQLRHLPAVGGLSAVGLLLQSAGCRHVLLSAAWFLLPENVATHAQCWHRASRKYGIGRDEWNGLIRENDELGWDFLTMAWRHTRAEEAAAIPTNMAAQDSATPTAGAVQITTQSITPRGYRKRCVHCGVSIYLHLDGDGHWRPYDSWKEGRVLQGQWRLHVCGGGQT